MLQIVIADEMEPGVLGSRSSRLDATVRNPSLGEQ
jgi:hypothetical protein